MGRRMIWKEETEREKKGKEYREEKKGGEKRKGGRSERTGKENEWDGEW